MDIIFVIYGSIDQITGGYLYDRKVVEWLRAKGVGVHVHPLPQYRSLCAPLQGFTGQVRDLFRGNEKNENARPLVIVDELTHPSVFVPLLFRSGLATNLVTLVHHLRSDERLGPVQRLVTRMYEKLLLNRSALIIVNSSNTEASVRRWLKTGIPTWVCRPGCDTLPYLVDFAVQNDREKSPEGVRLLTVGNIIPRKGHIDLIRSLMTVSGLNWGLTIVGKDEPHTRYSRRLHAMIDSGNMGHRVRFAGTVDDAELVRLYRSADLFLFTSFHEGYGIALAEALRYGLPYIAVDSGGVREIIGFAAEGSFTEDSSGVRAKRSLSHNQGTFEGALRCRGGFLVDNDHPEIFGSILKRLIEDGKVRKSLSAEAHERSRELPTWEETGACFHSALQAVDARNV